MSRRSKPLTERELPKIALNFGEFSDDDDEPFEASDSEYLCSSEEESDSSDAEETVKNVRQFLQRKKIKLDSQPTRHVHDNINPGPNINSILDPEPNLDLEPNLDPQRSEDPVPNIEPNWGPVVGKHKPIAPFSIPSGVNDDVAAMLANGTPGDFFDAVVDDRVISLICNQTNIYATQSVMAADATPSSRLHDWIPTTNNEIRKFLGLVAWMGLVKMPKIADYWSNDNLFHNNFAKNVMSRNRFEMLLRMFHFNDNLLADTSDKLYKLKPLVNILTANFKSLYVPEEYVCIDETLLPFRGRLGFKQYIKSKRHKYGVKIFKLCSGSGYTYNFKVYAGKENSSNVTPESLVLYLMEDLVHQGRTLITDNWYTSVSLAKKMLSVYTHLIGTIRKNRKYLPQEVVAAKLNKGQIASMENDDGVTITNWKDKRNIYMLSTKHGNEMVEVSCNRQTKLKPKVVIDYNKGKAAVDLSDQMGAYSNPLRRSIKWFKKVGFELLLTTSVVNSFLIYKLVTNNNMSVTDFKKEIVKHLVTYNETTTVPRRVSNNHHQLEQKADGSKHQRRKICKNWYKKNSEQHGRQYAMNRTKKVDTFCKSCDKEPFLCIGCFNELHTN